MAVAPTPYTFNRGTGRLIAGVFAFVLFVIATFLFLIATTMSVEDKLAVTAAGLAFLALAVAV
jgi:hypothetical protein